MAEFEMGSVNFNDILSKADKIEALNVFEEIISFIKDIKPSLDTINHSIQENVKKMPQATKKISKVTEATEIATTEILNVLDGIFPKIDDITKNISEQFLDSQNNNNNILHLLKLLKRAIKDNISLKTILPDIEDSISRLENESGQDKKFDTINEKLQSITMDATSIMMSLQVQDITSQQLAAVKHLLDTIQERLSGILNKFESSQMQNLIDKRDLGFSKEKNETELHRKIAFDPNAVDAFDKSLNRQDMVDDLFEKHRNGEEIDDEVMASFDNNSYEDELNSENLQTEVNDEIITKDSDTNSLQESDDTILNEPVSQVDIDALFNNSAIDEVGDDEPVSQDDIDKLFNQ